MTESTPPQTARHSESAQDRANSLTSPRRAAFLNQLHMPEPLEAVADVALTHAHRAAERAKALAAEQAMRAEAALRERFGGYDTSNTAEHRRQVQMQRYKHLFELMDVRQRGSIPIDEIEDLFGAAGLYEARTEVGQLAYNTDTDGNGALDFDEFVNVMDTMCKYTDDSVSFKANPEIGGSFVFGTEGASLTMREVIFKTFDDPLFSQLSRVVSVVVVSAIIIAVLIFVLQSDPQWAHMDPLFRVFEGICATIFVVEYTTRILTCPSLRKFLISPSNTLDLLTIVPYFLEGIDEAFHPKGGFGGAMRILRVFRVFRIFKITKYIPYVQVLSAAAKGAAAPLGMAITVLSIGVLLLAFATFYAERGVWDHARELWINDLGEPSPFQDIGAGVYWAVVTLSTAGFGDIYPVTNWGRIMGSITALSGCIILSFPVAIYTDEFGLQYTEYEKRSALQAELRGANLIMTLLEARAGVLEEHDWPRVPAKTTLREHRSAAQPRNIALMRWAREVLGGALAAAPTSRAAVMESSRDAPGNAGTSRQASMRAGSAPTDAAGATAGADAGASKDQAASFSEIWSMAAARKAGGIVAPPAAAAAPEPRDRGWTVEIDVPSDDEELTHDLGRAQPTIETSREYTAQHALMTRLLNRMHGNGASAPAAPRGSSQTGLSAAVVPPLHSPGTRLARRPSDADVERQDSIAPVGIEDGYRRLIIRARRALRARRIATVGTASRMRPGEEGNDMVLAASSFAMEDFVTDLEVERAILELLSEFRKRVWAEVRALEAKFRDDLAIEVARRWQHWMAMPADYVADIAAPFVFRKRELRAAMGFSRNILGVGVTEVRDTRANRIAVPGGRQKTPQVGQTPRVATPSVMANLRDFLSGNAAAFPAIMNQTVGPAIAALPARAAAVGKQVRAQLPLALQPAPDLARNYKARIANKYTDLLGEEVMGELASTPRPEDDRAPRGAAGGSLRSSRSTPNLLHDASNMPAMPAGAHAGSHEWVMTPFGMSLLPRNLPTITSSIGSGTASISGAASVVPVQSGSASTRAGDARPARVGGLLGDAVATLLETAPTTRTRDEMDSLFDGSFITAAAPPARPSAPAGAPPGGRAAGPAATTAGSTGRPGASSLGQGKPTGSTPRPPSHPPAPQRR